MGPCGAGKSTLTARLKALGYSVKHIAQEHSYVSYMWQRIAKPDVLVFLDASYEKTIERRRLNWSPAEYTTQQVRLRHARNHAHLVLDTDALSPDDVEEQVIKFIRNYISKSVHL